MAISITESINTLVAAYKTQLRQPLKILQAKKAVYEQVNSAFSILSDYFSIVQDLSTPLKGTDTDSVYYAKSATSSDTSVVTATAENEASAGVHTISISQLAKNYTQVGKNYIDADTSTAIFTALGANTYKFDIMIAGTSTEIEVVITDGDTDDEILSNIASAINSSDAKVNATVTHQISSDSRLVLTTETTGNTDTILIKDTSGTLAETVEITTAEYDKKNTTEFQDTGTEISTAIGAGTSIISLSKNGVTKNIEITTNGTDQNEQVLTDIRDEINDASSSKLIAQVIGAAAQRKLQIMSADSSQDSTHYVPGDEDITPGSYTFTMFVKDDTTGNVTSADINVTVNAGDTNTVVLNNMKTAINASGLDVTATVDTDTDGNEYLHIVTDNANDVLSTEDKTGDLAETTSIINTDLFSVEDISDPHSGKTDTLAEYTGINTTDEKDNSSGGYIYKDTEINSEFILNGLSMERTSNAVTDAITGMTFNLLKVQTSPDVTIHVSSDADTVKGTVESWIDQYNSVLEYLYATTRVEEVGEEKFEGGPLSEEYFYKNLIWKFRSLMAKKVEGVTNSNYSHLFEIGITADSKGKLSISDSAKFEEALAENIANVSDLFNSTTEPEEGNTKGKAVELYDFIENYVKLGGYIDASEDAYDNRVEYLDTRIARMETSILRKLAAYRKSLGRMQEMMAMLQGQHTMLMMYYGSSTGTSF